jgi:hypothetical protein
MGYKIRIASDSDILIMVEWANNEGWNPGINDHVSFQTIDPSGFFVGYIGEEVVSSISAVRYSDQFAFVGFYIVKPEYRGKGMGIQIWNHGMNYSKDVAIVGLDGVVEQQENYKKSGFKLAHRNVRYGGIMPEVKNSEELIKLHDLSLSVITEFENKLFPCNRSNFLKSWFANADKALAYVKNNVVLGYGAIRKCSNGYKIGPLFANSAEVAEQLLLGLCNNIAKENIYLDVPMPNKAAIKLAEKYKLSPVFETARMYTNQDPGLDLNKVFGITSFEVG